MIKNKKIACIVVLVGHMALIARSTIDRTIVLTALASKNYLYLFGDTSKNARVNAAYATKENIRGAGYTPAYTNQDRAFIGCLRKIRIFGICDGHGKQGDIVAEFAQKNLGQQVLSSRNPAQALPAALKEIQEILKDMQSAQHAGATAVTAVLDEHNNLTVAHIGDSRLIVIRNGKVVFTTRDHKPTDLIEKARIEAQGGFVQDGRARHTASNSSFALARSLGDIQAQGKILISTPEVKHFLVRKDDHIVLASDGVWDVLDNEEIVRLIGEGGSEQEKADRVVNEARAEKSRDDITAVVVHITQ